MKGYFVWSFLDVFELLAGYYSRYGLYHVDFKDPELPRQPKLSAQWYSKFVRSEIRMFVGTTLFDIKCECKLVSLSCPKICI